MACSILLHYYRIHYQIWSSIEEWIEIILLGPGIYFSSSDIFNWHESWAYFYSCFRATGSNLSTFHSVKQISCSLIVLTHLELLVNNWVSGEKWKHVFHLLCKVCKVFIIYVLIHRFREAIKGADERLTQRAPISSPTLTYAVVAPGCSCRVNQTDGRWPGKVQRCVRACVCRARDVDWWWAGSTVSGWILDAPVQLQPLSFICAFLYTPVTLRWMNCCGFPDVLLCICVTHWLVLLLLIFTHSSSGVKKLCCTKSQKSNERVR